MGYAQGITPFGYTPYNPYSFNGAGFEAQSSPMRSEDNSAWVEKSKKHSSFLSKNERDGLIVAGLLTLAGIGIAIATRNEKAAREGEKALEEALTESPKEGLWKRFRNIFSKKTPEAEVPKPVETRAADEVTTSVSKGATTSETNAVKSDTGADASKPIGNPSEEALDDVKPPVLQTDGKLTKLDEQAKTQAEQIKLVATLESLKSAKAAKANAGEIASGPSAPAVEPAIGETTIVEAKASEGVKAGENTGGQVTSPVTEEPAAVNEPAVAQAPQVPAAPATEAKASSIAELVAAPHATAVETNVSSEHAAPTGSLTREQIEGKKQEILRRSEAAGDKYLKDVSVITEEIALFLRNGVGKPPSNTEKDRAIELLRRFATLKKSAITTCKGLQAEAAELEKLEQALTTK